MTTAECTLTTQFNVEFHQLEPRIETGKVHINHGHACHAKIEAILATIPFESGETENDFTGSKGEQAVRSHFYRVIAEMDDPISLSEEQDLAVALNTRLAEYRNTYQQRIEAVSSKLIPDLKDKQSTTDMVASLRKAGKELAVHAAWAEKDLDRHLIGEQATTKLNAINTVLEVIPDYFEKIGRLQLKHASLLRCAERVTIKTGYLNEATDEQKALIEGEIKKDQELATKVQNAIDRFWCDVAKELCK
jgi:hypothetical protein